MHGWKPGFHIETVPHCVMTSTVIHDRVLGCQPSGPFSALVEGLLLRTVPWGEIIPPRGWSFFLPSMFFFPGTSCILKKREIGVIDRKAASPGGGMC